MILLETDQRITILGADRAGVLVGHVDAGKWQANVVDDVVELVGRDRMANRLFDQIKQTRRLLNTRARLGANVHQDLSGIDRRKEVFAEKRPQAEGKQDAGKEGDNKGLGASEGEQQQRAVAVADS